MCKEKLINDKCGTLHVQFSVKFSVNKAGFVVLYRYFVEHVGCLFFKLFYFVLVQIEMIYSLGVLVQIKD